MSQFYAIVNLKLMAYRAATDFLVALQRHTPEDEDALLEATALTLAGSLRLMSEEEREVAIKRCDPDLARVVRKVLKAALWQEMPAPQAPGGPGRRRR